MKYLALLTVLATLCGARDSLKVRTGTAPINATMARCAIRATGDTSSDAVLRPGTSWYVAGDGLLVKSNYAIAIAIVAEPLDTGSWRYVFHTKRHGEVDLADLLDKMDSVLDGRGRCP